MQAWVPYLGDQVGVQLPSTFAAMTLGQRAKEKLNASFIEIPRPAPPGRGGTVRPPARSRATASATGQQRQRSRASRLPACRRRPAVAPPASGGHTGIGTYRPGTPRPTARSGRLQGVTATGNDTSTDRHQRRNATASAISLTVFLTVYLAASFQEFRFHAVCSLELEPLRAAFPSEAGFFLCVTASHRPPLDLISLKVHLMVSA